MIKLYEFTRIKYLHVTNEYNICTFNLLTEYKNMIQIIIFLFVYLVLGTIKIAKGKL